MNPLFLALIIGLSLIAVWIGFKSEKDLKTDDDFFLMGKQLTLIPLGLSMLATQLGGGTLFGAAEAAFNQGFWVLAYPLGNCLGLIILGCGFGAKLSSFNISTVPELLDATYGSRYFRLLASVLSAVSLLLILMAMVVTAKQFLASIGYTNPLILICCWLVLVAYTSTGGLKAVVITDMIQALFIAFVLACAFGIAYYNLPTVMNHSISTPTNLPLSQWFLNPLAFMLISQDMGQRCFAAKNPKAIQVGSIFAAVMLFGCSATAITFGVWAQQLGIVPPEGGNVFIIAAKALTNDITYNFILAAALIAIVSTADSLLCSISSHLNYDFLQSYKGDRLKLSKVLTFAVGIFALVFGYFFESILGVLLFAYGLNISIMFVPIMAALFSKKPNKTAACWAMWAGGFGFAIGHVFNLPIPPEPLALTLALVSYLIQTTAFQTVHD